MKRDFPLCVCVKIFPQTFFSEWTEKKKIFMKFSVTFWFKIFGLPSLQSIFLGTASDRHEGWGKRRERETTKHFFRKLRCSKSRRRPETKRKHTRQLSNCTANNLLIIQFYARDNELQVKLEIQISLSASFFFFLELNFKNSRFLFLVLDYYFSISTMIYVIFLSLYYFH